MNQQSLMAALSVYPAPKASDELMWQELRRAWREEGGDDRKEGASDVDATDAQCGMAQRIEKVLLITRLSWSTR
jgi:hypothetical protein